MYGALVVARLLLDRGSTAIDERVQRGHDRSFQPYSPMGWRVALRSGRVHKPCQRLRSSGSRYARHRSHIRQLRRARTIRHGPGRASGRAIWCGDGPGRPRPTRGRHTRRPGGRVVCTGIDNPGGNVFPASRPVWQWGGTRYNFYRALRLTRREERGRRALRYHNEREFREGRTGVFRERDHAPVRPSRVPDNAVKLAHNRVTCREHQQPKCTACARSHKQTTLHSCCSQHHDAAAPKHILFCEEHRMTRCRACAAIRKSMTRCCDAHGL